MKDKLSNRSRISITLFIVLLLAVAGVLYFKVFSGSNTKSSSNKSSFGNSNKKYDIKDVAAFAPECAKIDAKKLQQILKVNNVELVKTSVSRQETVNNINQTCPYTLVQNNNPGQIRLTIAIQQDKQASDAAKNKDQLKLLANNNSSGQKNEIIKDLGDQSVLKEISDKQGHFINRTLTTVKGNITYTVSTNFVGKSSDFSVSKDQLIEVVKTIIK